MIDTNVLLVANGQHEDVSDECIVACAKMLQTVRDGERIAIDDGFRILGEYQHKTEPRAGTRPGDAFLKWLLQNHANPTRCDQVALEEHTARGFVSFPDDARLAAFDPPDRKFVAVAMGHEGKPPIVQAADSKWLGWSAALRDAGLDVEFICPDDIQGFEEKKKKRKNKGVRGRAR